MPSATWRSRGPDCPARYAFRMARDIEHTRSRPPVLRRAVALVVLVAVAALAVHLIVGLVMAVFWFVVVVAAIAAVLWAVKTLVW